MNELSQTTKPKITRVAWIAGLLFILLAIASLSTLGERVKYHMQTITSFSLRYYLGLEPELSRKIKIFIYDDPTVAKLGKYDLEMSEWAAVLNKLAQKKPQAILVDKLFDDPRGIEGLPELTDVLREHRNTIHFANFTTPQIISGRNEIISQPEWLDTSNLQDENLHYAYGASSAIEKQVLSGHVRYEGDGLISPISVLKSGRGVPHISFLIDTRKSLKITGGNVYYDNAEIPTNTQKFMRVNQLHRDAIMPRTYNMVELYRRSFNEKDISVVKEGDIVIILPAMYTGSTDWISSPVGLIQGGFIITSLVNSHLQENWLRYFEYDIVLILLFSLLGAAIAYYSWGVFFGLNVILITSCIFATGIGSFLFLNLEWGWFYAGTSFLLTSIIVALERSRLSGLIQVSLENEMRTSELVQRTFLSYSDSQNPHINIEHYFRPATKCSGDWWGHFAIDDEIYCVIIADAIGHGTPAALITAMAYSSYKTFAELNEKKIISKLSPSMILNHFNTVLYSAVQSNYFMTCSVLFFNTKTGKLVISNAGHVRPIRLKRDEEKKASLQSLISKGSPLGLNSAVEYEDKEFQLNEGDRVVLFTDGIYECLNAKGEQWERKRFQRSLYTHKHLKLFEYKNEIMRNVFDHMESVPPDDDMTLVVIEWLGEHVKKRKTKTAA